MGDQQNSKVTHLDSLSNRMRSILTTGDNSDITFITKNERVPAHTLVLAATCDNFRTRLLKRSSSGKMEVVVDGPSPESLKLFLSYIYSGRLSLGDLIFETIVEILKLSHESGAKKLYDAILRYLPKIFSEQNACLIYAMSQFLELEDLSHLSLDWIDRHPHAVLESDALLQLPAESLREILERDSLFVEEIKIFEAVKRWAAEPPHGESFVEVVETIRLPLIARTDLLGVVKKSNLVPADRLLDALVWQTEDRNVALPHRGSWVPEVNFATTDRGAKVLTGKQRDHLLEPKIPPEGEVDQKFTSHDIGDPKGITVDLGKSLKINHIAFRLLDKDSESYSYFVDVSRNLHDWHRVIDHSNYLCRSVQQLFFEPPTCRYIRVVGTRSSKKNSFCLVSFKAMFTRMPFELWQGIVAPRSNVASLEMGARVIEGDNGAQDSSYRQGMIDGNWRSYGYVDGFTQHTIGPGRIILRLAQPYIIDSIRMLLWCRDNRQYSYFIETSTDMKKWTRVVDHTSELRESWQVLRFKERPVVFIKIVGTKSTAIGSDKRWFHVAHFECPAEECG